MGDSPLAPLSVTRQLCLLLSFDVTKRKRGVVHTHYKDQTNKLCLDGLSEEAHVDPLILPERLSRSRYTIAHGAGGTRRTKTCSLIGQKMLFTGLVRSVNWSTSKSMDTHTLRMATTEILQQNATCRHTLTKNNHLIAAIALHSSRRDDTLYQYTCKGLMVEKIRNKWRTKYLKYER